MHKVAFFLGELDAADIHWFLNVGHTLKLPKDSVLIQCGKNIKALYILLEGQLVVRGSGPDHPVIARLGVGEIVGELSFLDHRPPSATVETMEEAEVLAIPRFELEEKLISDEGFAARFYRAIGVLLASRLRKTVSNLGHPQNPQLSAEELGQGLDDDLMETIGIAEGWFDFIMKKLHDESDDHWDQRMENERQKRKLKEKQSGDTMAVDS